MQADKSKIVQRGVKGSPLTHTELDGNFTELVRLIDDVGAFPTPSSIATTDVLQATDQALRTDLATKQQLELFDEEVWSTLSAANGATKVNYNNRTQYQKNADVISVRDHIVSTIDGVTDNQAGIIAAINAAAAVGGDLYWPAGTYVSTDTIPNFHTVRHVGSGVLKRGTDTFKFMQRGAIKNIIYVAKTGSNTNDGLTPDKPFLTIQAGINAINLYRPLPGAWDLAIAAGTYEEYVDIPSWMNPSSNYFTIRGPAQATVQSTPTVIVKYPGAGAVGFDCNLGNAVKVMDIKFANWRGSAVTGINVDDHSILWTYNVHAVGCRQGIVNNGAKLYCQGGRLTGYPMTDEDADLSGLPKWSTGTMPAGGGSVGVVTYAGGVSATGYNSTSLANGTIIEGFALAGYEGKSHTHVVATYVTYRCNLLGVWVYTNARYDEHHCDYSKNRLVMRLQKGVLFKDVDEPSEYHWGETHTAGPTEVGDGNLEGYRFNQYSNEDATLHTEAIGGLDICRQRITTTQTGTIPSTLTRALCTIYQGMLNYAPNGKYLEVFLCGTTTGSADTKTIDLKMGSTVLATFTVAAGTQTWTARVEIWPNNSTSQIVIATATGATVGATRATRATDMNLQQVVEVWQTIPGASDTASLHEARCITWG